jgi:ABC-type nitrate/sulfonate/bicarbonate transport system substrate-binding protein
MRSSRQFLVGCLALLLAATGLFSTEAARGAESFADSVGPVTVAAVKNTKPLEVPFIIWGGDVATFLANGGLTTKPGTIFQKQGLDLKLVPGDNFVEQVRRYMAGQTPFLRGEMQMIGLASEVTGSDPRTKPVVFLQMTWSAGDHLVAREGIKSLDDLKGKKIAIQKGGPHVGMVDEILRRVKLTWDDITVVWADDLTGAKGPAELFRKDPSIDACTVISPDMIGLTGGPDSKGSGAEGTVKGAHVAISTATMSRSIADVYACRKDFYDAHRDIVEKFAAGYLKATEDLVALKNEYNEKGQSPKYMDILKLTQTIYGPDTIPTLEVDAHGLVSDATFVGLPGNVSFFTDKGNLAGFDKKQQAVLDLAVGQGYAKVRSGFFGPDFDYQKLAKTGGLKAVASSSAGGRFTDAESVDMFAGDELDENTLYQFTIGFEPNQNTFSADVYGQEFLRAVEAATTFGNAVIAIRGHADPTKTLVDLIQAGMASGTIKRSGTKGDYKYFVNGKPLDLSQTQAVVDLIDKGAFVSGSINPRETMQAALNLSRTRAEAVRDAIIAYASANELTIDITQLQPVGVGVREPLVPKPTNIEEARQNMRVEFRVLKVPAEVVKQGDFDF